MKRIMQLIAIILILTVIGGCEIPRIEDVEANKNKNLYAGQDEVCKNSLIDVECAQGLECIEVTNKPTIVAKCLPPGTKVDKDNEYWSDMTNNS